MGMAKEIVNVVKEAELKALEVEAEAKKACESMLIKAQEEAKAIVQRELELVGAQGKRALEEAQKLSEKKMSEIIQRATEEKVRLEEVTKTKEQLAIKLILSEII